MKRLWERAHAWCDSETGTGFFLGFVACAILVALTGCGEARDIRAAQDHENAQKAYVACLQTKGEAGCKNEKAMLNAAADYYATRMGRYHAVDAQVNVRGTAQ